MFVEGAIGELFGDRIARAEVDHVERADRNHLRNTRLPRGRHAVWTGVEDTADEVIGQFRGGDVENSRKIAPSNQILERSATGSCHMKDDHFVPELLKQISGVHNAGCRHTEHRCGDEGFG